ncbi:hypothetical protein OAA19_01200 [Rubripirellula sp.]|nr:hypothetical protein [Rubripirellula sp.]MDB4338704.1 hypothetical protein [Rubripirellula sp.]
MRSIRPHRMFARLFRLAAFCGGFFWSLSAPFPREFLARVAILPLFLMLSFNSVSCAQPPGTQPPKELLDNATDDSGEDIPVRAFMFLSESGNPVLMPSLTWEEFERYLSLDAGLQATRQKYVYQSLELSGTAIGDRAELEIRLVLSIDPTEGGWTTIPLRLGNFHRLEPLSLAGELEQFSAVASDGSGYNLFVKNEKRVETTLIMRVSAKIEVGSNSRSLSFQLPDVPSKVRLKVEEETATAEVLGRGDEVIRVLSGSAEKTEIEVESSGGDYSLRWGPGTKAIETDPIFEVDSRTNVRWDSPQDALTASVRLSVSNLSGSVQRFQLELPENAVILEAPTVGPADQAVDIGPPLIKGGVQLREVVIPDDAKQQRVDLNFEYQLPGENVTKDAPLLFRVADVIGALRHRGDIDMTTPDEYRLRWRGGSWVRSLPGDVREEVGVNRSYRFAFDRSAFSLQLWLGVKERQLRVSTRSEMTTREQIATLWMQVELSGQTEDGRVRFDDAGWQVRVVESQFGTPVTTYLEDEVRVMDLSSIRAEESSRLIIQLQKTLETRRVNGDLELTLPRIILPDDSAVVRDSTLVLINDGRKAFVVNLEASTGVARSSIAEPSVDGMSEMTTFRVVDGLVAPVIIGDLIEQPSRIVLTSDTDVELDAGQIRQTTDWLVSAPLDLEGRLSLRIPRLSLDIGKLNLGPDQESVEAQIDVAEAIDSEVDLRDELKWVVTVDDLPAKLLYEGADKFLLISDRLVSGTMRVRFKFEQQLPDANEMGGMVTVSLPRPDFSDVTLRGPVVIKLRGDQSRDLVAIESPGKSELELLEIPREPYRLRLLSKQENDDELLIKQAIVRTLMGYQTRHEQILATVQGGDRFEVQLQDNVQLSMQGSVDGNEVNVRREGSTLVVPLPSDASNHAVDLRVWLPKKSSPFVNRLSPSVFLPPQAGRVYWQVIGPIDAHAVWASPTMGQSMSWRFDRWRFYRDPIYRDQSLLELVGSTDNQMPPGNRYLYEGTELQSFEVVLISRVVLWLLVGSLVIITTILMTYSRSFRSPLSIVVAATSFAGLLLLAPDAAVLSGQLVFAAIFLVVVMIALRAYLVPSSERRLFTSSGGSIENGSSSFLRGKNTNSIQTLELVNESSEVTAEVDP